MMKSLMTKVWRFFRRDEEGASMVEYALLVSLIAIVAILAITATGTAVRDIFQAIADALTPAP